MDRAEIQAALAQIAEAVREKFPHAIERLAQLDSHLATVGMVVDHIHDEADRTAAEQAVKAGG